MLFINELTKRSSAYPFATNLSLASIPIGLLAVAFGQDVSKAFTYVYHRPEPVYVWGVVLLLGGFNVAAAIAGNVPSKERGGLYVLAAGWAFYGVSVIIGLGQGGLVSGPLALIVAVSCVQRARSIMAHAKVVAAVIEDLDGRGA